MEANPRYPEEQSLGGGVGPLQGEQTDHDPLQLPEQDPTSQDQQPQAPAALPHLTDQKPQAEQKPLAPSVLPPLIGYFQQLWSEQTYQFEDPVAYQVYGYLVLLWG